ncbi:FecR family protein [Chitinophaga lutea]
MDIEQIKKVLERYTQGKCTAEETSIIEQWFASVNQHRSAMIDDDFLQEQLDEVKMRLQEHVVAPQPLPGRRTFKLRRLWYGAAAAAVLTGIVAVALLNRPMPASPIADMTQPAVRPAVAKTNKVVRNGFVEITTTKGATEKVVLADGSTVIVNASSRIRFPEKFGDKERRVYLEEGEAFFKAASDPARAFVVQSGDVATTALGTSFNIRAYSREHKITVALITGKVKVDHAQKTGPVILLPSERLSIDCKSLDMAKTTFGKEDEVIGWKQGFLVFRDASYDEVMAEIENRYNVTVVNESGKTEWNYTGFFKDENLQDIFETICLTKNISYEIKQDTIFLKSKN